jgi:hypothetical protein
MSVIELATHTHTRTHTHRPASKNVVISRECDVKHAADIDDQDWRDSVAHRQSLDVINNVVIVCGRVDFEYEHIDIAGAAATQRRRVGTGGSGRA